MNNATTERADLTIHAAFRRQAEKTPEKVAVYMCGAKLTYRQLDRRANSVARLLLDRGVDAGDIVGLHMQRSLNIIVAKLAILKCGAAYLPVDRQNPDRRNLHALGEAKCSHLVSDGGSAAFSAALDIDIIDSLEEEAFVTESDTVPPIECSVEAPAYVMFTSGSTGAPKGVVVPHRAVIRLVRHMNYVPSIDTSDNILQFSSLSFDAATFEIWGALLNGARLVLYSGDALDPNLFAREIEENEISILFITTALFHIVASRFLSSLAPLKFLLTGGDVLYPNLVNKVADAHPDLNLTICYGPTENTTFTTTHRITRERRPTTSVPIGRPINGTDIHLLDEEFRPVSKGEVGELFTSGAGVALGYLNRDNSRDDFFYDKQVASGLVYRTGDLARENENGDYEFIGRRDNQVKIRGFRASIEEIQESIVKLDEVEEAVVFLNNASTGDQQLISYVKLENRVSHTVAELKSMMGEELPHYMVPDRIFINEEFPLNKNGKICKSSLKANSTGEGA